MTRPGKMITAGIGVIAGTSLLTGATTAYMLRSTVPTESPTAAYASAPVRRAPAVAARVTPAVARTPVSTPRAVPVAATTASQCETGGDRALRIAKPGAIGGLLGAGLGAAGGAIADGGSGAGKGALIGGLVGAVAGAGYGAYKTNAECGTIFGDSGVPERAVLSETALRPRANDTLTIYPVR